VGAASFGMQRAARLTKIHILWLLRWVDASDFPEFVRFGASRFAVIEPRHVLDL